MTTEINALHNMDREAPSQSDRGSKSPENGLTEHPVVRSAPLIIPLYQMTFAVYIFDAPGSDVPMTIEFVTSKCLYPGDPLGLYPSDYKIELLRRYYKNKLDDRDDLPWEVAVEPNCGEFRYSHHGQLKTVRSQDDFEVAIAHLYDGGRCKMTSLSFSFEPDSFRSKSSGAMMERVPKWSKSQDAAQMKEFAHLRTASATSTSKAAQLLRLPGTRTNVTRETPEMPGNSAGGAGADVLGAQPSRPSEASGLSSTQSNNSSTQAVARTQAVSHKPGQQSAGRLESSNKASTPPKASSGLTQAPATLRITSMPPNPAQLESLVKELQTRTSYLRRRPNKIKAVELLASCDYDVNEAVAHITGSVKKAPQAVPKGESRNEILIPKPITSKAASRNGKDSAKTGSSRHFGDASQPAKRQPGVAPRSAASSAAAITKSTASDPSHPKTRNISQPAELKPETAIPEVQSNPTSPGSKISRQTRTPKATTTSRTSLGSSISSAGKKASETFRFKVKRNLTIGSSPTRSHTHSDRSRFSGIVELVKSPFIPKPDADELDEKCSMLFTQTRVETFIKGGEEEPVEKSRSVMTDDGVYDSLDIFDDNDVMLEESEPNAKLKDLQMLGALEQLENGNRKSYRWRECCRMFGIDEEKTGIDERVPIFGIRTLLFQYQAFAVYWAMLNSRAVGGGIIADTPGLGKTLSFIAYIVVERQLVMLWDEVEASRRTGAGKHLLESQHTPNDVCPTYPVRKGEGWIPCPCASSNPTSRMPKKMGVRIAVVPASLIDGWRANWANHVDSISNGLNMKLLLAHSASNFHAETDEIVNTGRNIALLSAVPVHRGVDAAKKDQDRFLVLTTVQSYESFTKTFKYDKTNRGGRNQRIETLQEYTDNGTKKLKWKTGGTKLKINFGIAVADECHESVHKGKGRPGILAKLPGHPFCWGLSGTPFDQSPRGIEPMLWAIESQALKSHVFTLDTGWQQDPNMSQFQWSVLDQIANEFQDLLEHKSLSSKKIDNLLYRFEPFLTTFMIRRDGEMSVWFGHRLMRLNPHTHRDVYLQHHAAYDVEIEKFGSEAEVECSDALAAVQNEWQTKPRGRVPTALKYDAKMRVAFKLRLMATCPYLSQLAISHNLALTPEELFTMRDIRKNIYVEHLESIFETSPKLLWLQSFIRKLDKAKDSEGKDQKLLILTGFPVLAFIIKLMIEKYIPGGKELVGEIHNRLRHNDRQAISEAFTDKMEEGSDGVTRRKQKRNIRYLVGTTFLLAAGHQLTRSCNVVLMEPAYIFYHEKQAYARVHRIGQKNPASFSYRLIDEGSQIEKQILERQVARRDLVGKVKNIQHVPDAYLQGDIFTQETPRFSYIAHINGDFSRDSYVSPQASMRSFNFPTRSSSLQNQKRPSNSRKISTSAKLSPREDSLAMQKTSLATRKDTLATLKKTLASRKGTSESNQETESKLAQAISSEDNFDVEPRSMSGNVQDPHTGALLRVENKVLPLNFELMKHPVTPPNLKPTTLPGDSPDWTPPRLW